MIKLLNSYYDEMDGISEATIQTDLGNFIGYAFLNEEDRDKASTYLGCEIAEARAIINYKRQKLYRVNVEIELLKNLPFSNEIEKIYKNKLDVKKNLKSDIKAIREGIDKHIDLRYDYLEKMEKKKKEEQE